MAIKIVSGISSIPPRCYDKAAYAQAWCTHHRIADC